MNHLILLHIAFALSMLLVASIADAAERAELGTVLAIESSTSPGNANRFARNSNAMIGATIGAVAGRQLASNSSNRYAASSVGAAAGTAFGHWADRRARNVTNVVIQLDSGQVVAITDSRPTVREGQRIYLIGGNRVVAAGAR